MNTFRDRAVAGQQLARLLVDRAYSDPVVLALPRGGVPVGLEIARALKAPLDLVIVRKLGVPFQPEVAAGAVVDGDHPEVVINEEVAREARLTREDLAALVEEQLKEIERRRALYMREHSETPVGGRTAIIVDDGIATGATIRAALKATRQRNPARLVLAIPVAPADTIERLRPEVDDVVCLQAPEFFRAIGAFYTDFRQVSDHEVVHMLEEARGLVGSARAIR